MMCRSSAKVGVNSSNIQLFRLSPPPQRGFYTLLQMSADCVCVGCWSINLFIIHGDVVPLSTVLI